MLNAIKRNVTVQNGGRIEVFVPELPAGTKAEVIALEAAATETAKPPLVGMIGKGKGVFSSSEEVDRFIRAERDQWP